MIQNEFRQKGSGLRLTTMYFLDAVGLRHSKMLPSRLESRAADGGKGALVYPFVKVSGCIEQF